MSEDVQATQVVQPVQAMNDDETLEFTRKIRVNVVNELMSRGKIPEENSDRIFLTNMLSGLDSQAISSKRIAAEQKQNDNTSATIAALLRSIDRNKAFTGDPNNIIDITPKTLPDGIEGEFSANPGEMEVNPPQLDYNSFVKSQGRDVGELGRNTPHPEANSDDGDDDEDDEDY